MHNIESPKWMQKQKASPREDEDDFTSLEETRRAVCVSINSKFSVVATGMRRYVKGLL